jgi:hypothetical protein
MYYGRGMGRSSGRGYGRGTGFGFRGSSPPWPYVGIGRGGLPRCRAYGGFGRPGAGYVPSPGPVAFGPSGPYGPPAYGRGGYGASYSPVDEIHFLKDQAEMIRDELQAIDSRIKELEKEKAPGGES